MAPNIKLKQGEAVREFYSSLAIIEEYYSVKGYRKITYLFEVLHKKMGWKMSLRTFRYHINKHIIDGIFFSNPKTENKVALNLKIEEQDFGSSVNEIEDDGPKIARPNFKKGPKFNPHVEEPDRSRFL